MRIVKELKMFFGSRNIPTPYCDMPSHEYSPQYTLWKYSKRLQVSCAIYAWCTTYWYVTLSSVLSAVSWDVARKKSAHGVKNFVAVDLLALDNALCYILMQTVFLAWVCTTRCLIALLEGYWSISYNVRSVYHLEICHSGPSWLLLKLLAAVPDQKPLVPAPDEISCSQGLNMNSQQQGS